MIIFWFSLITIGVIVISTAIALVVSKDAIFKGSGKPISMARVVLSSIHVTSQILFGVLISASLLILISEKIISAEAGLPVLSAIAGYILGKSFKDISYNSEKKSSGNIPPK